MGGDLYARIPEGIMLPSKEENQSHSTKLIHADKKRQTNKKSTSCIGLLAEEIFSHTI